MIDNTLIDNILIDNILNDSILIDNIFFKLFRTGDNRLDVKSVFCVLIFLLFRLQVGSGYLRPFELATVRLQNMIGTYKAYI